MRRLVALLLLAPLALAQETPVELATLTIDAFPELARPLQGPVTTEADARVSCLLTDGASGVPVRFAIVDAPAWATPTISPSEADLDPQRCDEGWLATTATITVTADDQAPAFAPEPILVEVVAGPQGREQRGQASVAFGASYFSILDVQLAEAIVVIPPGGSHDFVVRVTNLGNGPTRVEPNLVDAGEGLSVAMPSPITLESRQQGGTRVQDDLAFRVHAPEENGYVNRVGVINVRYVSYYATDDSFADESPAKLSSVA